MSAQPAKRRKTSPLKATPVLSRNEQPKTAPRASYMSPTRASLSRFNPSLLPQQGARSASAGPATAQNMTPDQYIARGQEALNYIMGNFNAQMQRTMSAFASGANSPALGAGVNTPTMPSIFGNPQGQVQTPLGEETDEQMEAMRAAIRARKARQRSTGPSARTTPGSVRRASVPIVRTPSIADKDEEDELSMEVGRNDAVRSRAGSVRSSLAPQSAIRSIRSLPRIASDGPIEIDPVFDEALEIDELSPDAPKQPQPPSRTSLPSRAQRLVSEDADGLPDTPEAVRRQLEAEDHPRRGVLFSSPSKRRAGQGTPRKRRSEPMVVVENVAPVVPRMVEATELPTRAAEVPGPVEDASAPAPIPVVAAPAPPDPKVVAKREEKARLDKELEEMRDEVTKFEELAGIYTKDDGEPADQYLVAALNLLASDKTSTKEKQRPQPSLSSLLTSFLPFSIPKAAPPNPTASTEEEDEQFLSHAPLKEDDPLPLNALFTPLTITSSTHIPTLARNSTSIRQKHSITLTSPSALLSCKLDMTITSEPGTDAVPKVERLEMAELSSWARAEVGDWIAKRCQECDIATIGYGLGRYWDICVKRAQCWIQIQKLFPTLTTGTSLLSDEEAANLSKKQLLPHLGRASLELRDEEAVLRVGWKLGFDWTGEVESHVGVETGVPGNWHETDTSNALRKIPATFDAVMRERGVLKAVEVVGGLLFDTRT